MSDYAVLRPAPGFTLPSGDDGKWIDMTALRLPRRRVPT